MFISAGVLRNIKKLIFHLSLFVSHLFGSVLLFFYRLSISLVSLDAEKSSETKKKLGNFNDANDLDGC